MSDRSWEADVTSFRARLLVALGLVIVALTLGSLSFAERWLSAEIQHDLQESFASELTLVRVVREIRHATLAERCRALVRKPRIHAALEDNALDLLYPSAKDELGEPVPAGGETALPRHSMVALFYRFIDIDGTLIRPPNETEVGLLSPAEEQQLAFRSVPAEQQVGYFARSGGRVVEVIATPIISTETGEAIAALATGFPMMSEERPGSEMRSGLWLEGTLHMSQLDAASNAALAAQVQRVLAGDQSLASRGVAVRLPDGEHMLFCERLNPGSLFPPAYEVGLYPLAGLMARQRELRWKALGAGMLLLSLGVAASLSISSRLARPVRELAVVSAENRTLRLRAEEALQLKVDELERAARFSANASHQLKTPVAVLRAGLDELLASSRLEPDVRTELSMLVHQTFRLSSIIEDLLLLSRLDSGRLQLNLASVDLTHIVDTCVDDLQLLHDSPPEVEMNVPRGLHVMGDTRYTMLIVQNLVDNARKYGRAGEAIRIEARTEGGAVRLVVANRGDAIPAAAREQIFERFHRAAVTDNIPGHGLGLNLARELARLHGGDVSLIRSDGEWTEFEATFRPVSPVLREQTAA